jgi:hypothetical protein
MWPGIIPWPFLCSLEYIHKQNYRMGHIKKFHDFSTAEYSRIHEEDDSDLLRDLENIGMKEKTYTKEMFQDAMDNVNFWDHIELETYDEFNFNMGKPYSTSATITAYFEGGISGTWDTSSLWGEIVSQVQGLDTDGYADDEDRYTIDELESAFDSVSWDSLARDAEDQAIDDVEVEIDTSTRDNEVEIEAEASIDNDYTRDYVDEDDIIRDILDNL